MLLQIELPTPSGPTFVLPDIYSYSPNSFDFDSRSIRSKNAPFQAIIRCSLASCQAASEFPRSASVIRLLGLFSRDFLHIRQISVWAGLQRCLMREQSAKRRIHAELWTIAWVRHMHVFSTSVSHAPVLRLSERKRVKEVAGEEP